jgi:TonB family protein
MRRVPITIAAAAIIFLLLSSHSISAQRIAILYPEQSGLAGSAGAVMEKSLRSTGATIVDAALANAAFSSAAIDQPFNLDLDEARRVGAAIGCDGFILIRSETLQRTSSATPTYFESYAAIFAVSSRTGHLVWWHLEKVSDASARTAHGKLLERVAGVELPDFRRLLRGDTPIAADPRFIDLTSVQPAAKDIRPPVPYRRIKPEYTESAYLFGVRATVEVLVELDENGTVQTAEVARWAGFGLEDSVIKTVREMKWRPAERAGRFLPSRFLLRYNFKKIEKE